MGPVSLGIHTPRGSPGQLRAQVSQRGALKLSGVEAQRIKGWVGGCSRDGFISCCQAPYVLPLGASVPPCWGHALPSPLPPLPSQMAHEAHKEGLSFSTLPCEGCSTWLGG